MYSFTRITRLPARALGVFALVATLAACAGPAEDDAAAPDPGGTSSPSTSPPTSAPGSEGASSSPSKSPTKAPSSEAPAGPTLEVTLHHSTVPPTIVFSADRAGELHVHSKPEQYVEFAAGNSRQQLVIETPGTVEIEEHETGAVVAVVEVS